MHNTKSSWLTLMALLVVFVAWQLSVYKSPQQIEREQKQRDQKYLTQQAIVDDVKPLVDACRSLQPRGIELRGKALVWNISTDGNGPHDELSVAYDELPNALQAGSADHAVTVFMIISQKYDYLGDYLDSVSRLPVSKAYRRSDQIAIVYWPEKKPAGLVTVAGPDPPLSVSVPLDGKGSPLGNGERPVTTNRRLHQGSAPRAVMGLLSLQE